MICTVHVLLMKGLMSKNNEWRFDLRKHKFVNTWTFDLEFVKLCFFTLYFNIWAKGPLSKYEISEIFTF